MKIISLAILFIAAAILPGCASTAHWTAHGQIREDITDYTESRKYQEIAKNFLDDSYMKQVATVPDKSKIADYCQDFTGESGHKVKSKLKSIAEGIEYWGVTGLTGKGSMFDEKEGWLSPGQNTDTAAKINFCRNFLTFTANLSPDERRKLLVFLGDDFFSANWLLKSYLNNEYSKIEITDTIRNMIQEITFKAQQDASARKNPTSAQVSKGYVVLDAEPTEADKKKIADEKQKRKEQEEYFPNRVDWQFRNSGISMLGWFQSYGSKFDTDFGYLSPFAMDNLKQVYGYYKYDGFYPRTDVSRQEQMKDIDDNMEAVSGTESRKLRGTMTLAREEGTIRHALGLDTTFRGRGIVRNVWGVPDRFDMTKSKIFFEPFPPDESVNRIFFDLSQNRPDFDDLKKRAVDSVSDSRLDAIKGYAKWIIDNKKIPEETGKEGKGDAQK